MRVFRDEDMELSQVSVGHADQHLASGSLELYPDCLCLGSYRFQIDQISSMAMVQRRRLLLTCRESYYEIRTKKEINLRKYMSYWHVHKEKGR